MRVVQCMLQYGTADQRDRLFSEIKGMCVRCVSNAHTVLQLCSMLSFYVYTECMFAIRLYLAVYVHFTHKSVLPITDGVQVPQSLLWMLSQL